MTRTGKIARLPRAVRDELNRRLRDGETGVGLVGWLNRRAEVRQVLNAEFGGRAITEQNLSEWKGGGYAEWQSRQEMLEDAREMAADAGELAEATDRRLTDHLATVLAARFASVLTKWNGEVTEDIRGQLKLLHGMCGDVAELRRGDHGAFRREQEQERLDQAREKTEEEIFVMFDRWSKTPGLRDMLCKDWLDPDERGRQMRASFGLPPLEIQKQKLEKQKAEMEEGVVGSVQLAVGSKGGGRRSEGGEQGESRREGDEKPGNQGGSDQIKPFEEGARLEARGLRQKQSRPGGMGKQKEMEGAVGSGQWAVDSRDESIAELQNQSGSDQIKPFEEGARLEARGLRREKAGAGKVGSEASVEPEGEAEINVSTLFAEFGNSQGKMSETAFYSRAGQIWELVDDCDLQIQFLFSAPIFFTGTVSLRVGERVRVLSGPKELGRDGVAFVPVRYGELHDELVPLDMRTTPRYKRFQLAVAAGYFQMHFRLISGFR